MQTFKIDIEERITRRVNTTTQKQSWFVLYITLLLTTGILIWFSQNSINAYWQQTYHRSSPLTLLDEYEWWKKGGELSDSLNEEYHSAQTWFQMHNEQWQAVNSTEKLTNESTIEHDNVTLNEPNTATDSTIETETTEENNTAGGKGEIIESALQAPTETEENRADNLSISLSNDAEVAKDNTETDEPKGYVSLTAKDKVFFAGDSLMQGVAPFVQKKLRENQIDSINLSKQSTGLSYPSFFDWPETIEKTLKENKDIKLLVMFLGANDPWDFANPEKPKGSYLRFKSPEWESVYRQRIERILTAAETAKVKVIWLGAPYMRSKKLNDQMIYLNTVYEAVLAPRVIWLPTHLLLSNNQPQYQDSIPYKGKSTKVRSKDGIHFSRSGQELLAEYVLEHIRFNN